MEISFVGIGRLGGALALALSEKKYRIKNFVARNRAAAEKIAREISPPPSILHPEELAKLSASNVIFITTQDGGIEPAAQKLAAELTGKPIVFHTSGSLSSDVLKPLREIGCRAASLHPLVSISDSLLGARRFADVYFCLEGDAEAVRIGEKIVADLKGKHFSIETKFKPLYHASAVTSAGHLTALFAIAVEMLSACGLNSDEAQKILLPLARSTVENLETQTPSEALTGTFARGDTETLRKHLFALRGNVSREALEIYLQLGISSLHLAELQGVNAKKIAEMRELLRRENK